MVRESINKKKVLRDPGPYTQRSFDSQTPPLSPQKGVPGYGGVQESNSKKSLGDHFRS